MAGVLSLIMLLGVLVSPFAAASARDAGGSLIESGSLDIHIPRNGKDAEDDAEARQMLYFKLAETEDSIEDIQKKYATMSIDEITAELGEGTKTPESIVKDGHDVIEIRGLEDGIYVFKETEDSYEKHEHKITTIAWNAASGLVTPVELNAKTFKPENLKPLVLRKIAYEGEEKKEITLAGVEFELYQADKKDQAIKLIDKGNGIYEYGEGGDKSTLVTNMDGKIEIKNLPEGKYFFRETKTLEGYILNDKNRDSKEITYNPAEGKDINITNNKEEKTTISLHKIDGESKEKLKDVEFKLYVKSGNKSTPVGIKDGQYVAAENMDHTFKTDADGKILVDNLPELAKGEKYVFREVKTLEGYKLVDDQIHEAIENQDITVKNYKNPEPIEIKLTKIDSISKKPLDRVGFELFRVKQVENPDTKTLETTTERVSLKGDSGKYEYNAESAQSEQVYQLHTNSNGQIVVNGLPDGQYYFKENIVIDNYELPENRGKESERLNREKNTTELTNKPVNPNVTPPTSNIPKGGYRFVKVDDSPEQKRLAGAIFALYKVDGNGKVTPYEVDGKRLTIKSGENGEFEVRGLPNGKYALKETVAPDGHLLDMKLIEFTASATSYANDAIMIVNKRTPRQVVPPTVNPPSNPPVTQSPPTPGQPAPPAVTPPGTRYYVPSNTPGVPRGPLVKTGDIRIVILVAVGIIMIGGGVYLVRKSEKEQRVVLA